MKFLLFEDDKADSIFMKNVLKGHQVDVYEDFLSSDIHFENYDFIVSDYFLKSGTALDIMNYLNSKNSNIPFIVVTGKANDVPKLFLNTFANTIILSKNDDLRYLLQYYINFVKVNNKHQNTEVDLERNLDYELLFKQLVHDLKNDLSVCKTLNELQQDEEGEEKIEILNMIANQSVYAAGKLTDIMHFVSKKLEYSSLANVFDNILTNEFIKKHKENINITGDVDVEINVISKYYVNVILKNLIENSIKHSSNNSKLKIEIGVENAKGYILLSVCDNGAGMNHETASSLFHEEQSSMNGSGIGLTILNQIISEHKGIVSVKSLEGIGTDIYIKFPK